MIFLRVLIVSCNYLELRVELSVQVGWRNRNDWMKFVTDASEIFPVVLVLAALLL